MNVMRRLKSIASGRSSVSDPGGDFSLKRVKVEQEVDHRVDGETQSEEQCTIAPKQDVTSTSNESSATTLNVDTRPEKSGFEELPKEMNEMKIRDDKTNGHEDDIKDMEPAVVSGNGQT
uniref:Predicted Shaggy-like kinase ortholog n=1 Tax=Nicotiana alata TaxID=4087 RepID=U6C2V9_NICAL|nr:predicted Shaggy-like kinase ortholog [Nicotiana alata]